jgi:ABC-type lipoprotein export system ATPase subunit
MVFIGRKLPRRLFEKGSPIAWREALLLSVRGLRHAYSGRTVLSIDEWDVPQGEASLVMGSSGSGKSTLLAIIAGLLSATAGSVKVGDTEVTGLAPAQRDRFRARAIGLVPQTLHLIGVLTVRENLGLARDVADWPPTPPPSTARSRRSASAGSPGSAPRISRWARRNAPPSPAPW